jgi:hypothetical protein
MASSNADFGAPPPDSFLFVTFRIVLPSRVMAESFATRRMRWGFNFFPAYRGTGGRITYIAANFREVRIRLPLSWRTRLVHASVEKTTYIKKKAPSTAA